MEEAIGIVLVTHGNLGEALTKTFRLITGPYRHLAYVSVRANDDVESVRSNIASAIQEVKGSLGTILLVDMFGGTPSNIGLSFLARDEVEVVTGVNLPMLTKLASLDGAESLAEAAAILRDYGRQHIKVAAEYLSGQ